MNIYNCLAPTVGFIHSFGYWRFLFIRKPEIDDNELANLLGGYYKGHSIMNQNILFHVVFNNHTTYCGRKLINYFNYTDEPNIIYYLNNKPVLYLSTDN